MTVVRHIAGWSQPKIAEFRRAIARQPNQLPDPPLYVPTELFTLNALEGDPQFGRAVKGGRLFNALEITLNFAEGATAWSECILVVEAITGSVVTPICRRKLSTLITERGGAYAQLGGLVFSTRGRPAQQYRAYVLSNLEEDTPQCFGSAIAWGAPGEGMSGDQAAQLITASRCRNDQGFTYSADLQPIGTTELTLRNVDGGTFTTNPSGGRLAITTLALGSFAGAQQVTIAEGPTGGPYFDLVEQRGTGAFQFAQQYDPPLLTRPGSVIAVSSTNQLSVSITGFWE